MSLGIGYEQFSFDETVAIGYYEQPDKPLILVNDRFTAYSFRANLGVNYNVYENSRTRIIADGNIIVDYTPLQFYYQPMLSVKGSLRYEKKLSPRSGLFLDCGLKLGFRTFNTLYIPLNTRSISLAIGFIYKL